MQRRRTAAPRIGRRQERKDRGDIVSRIAIRGPSSHPVYVYAVSQTRNGAKEGARDGANSDVGDGVIRTAAVGPAGGIRNRIRIKHGDAAESGIRRAAEHSGPPLIPRRKFYR